MSLYPEPADRPTANTLRNVGQNLPTAKPGEPRDPGILRAILAQIDAEGWAGPSGTALLAYVRETIVRPLTVDLGMRGAASGQAEASAWEDVWMLLREPGLRAAESPWGMVWWVARRAVLTEAVCARFPTSPRRAWHLAKAQAEGLAEPVVRLDDVPRAALPAVGQDGAPPRSMGATDTAIEALTAVGWPREQAAAIVEDVLHDTPTTRSTRWTARAHGWTSYGWRTMAERLDLPAWQARRLVIVLRGNADRPGLLPRMILTGGALTIDAELHAALASTRIRSRPSPLLRELDPECSDALQERAS